MSQASREQAQLEARRWGLPATGPTEAIARRVAIVMRHPAAWSREDFEIILPHLSVHQDMRATHAGANVERILHEGLRSGMVDAARQLEPGAQGWSWAKGYTGRDAFLFVSGGLQYRSRESAYLAPRNRPIFHARPVANGSLWDALATSLTPVDVGAAAVQPRAAESVAVGDVFRYDSQRTATVYAVSFGRVEVKIEGTTDGRPSTRIGFLTVGECKLMERVGRAQFQDGCLVSPPLDVRSGDRAGYDDNESERAPTKTAQPRMR